jgi:hypothetical protein
MKITITQQELFDILKERYDITQDLDTVAIKVRVENRQIDDIICFYDNDEWFVGSFIEEQIKNKGENNV